MYKIIKSHLPQEFEQLVNDALKTGWQLIGGVSVIAMPTSQQGVFQNAYFQAVYMGDRNTK